LIVDPVGSLPFDANSPAEHGARAHA
jgi:hypothetical protein